MAESRLLSVATELQEQVMEYCEASELLALARTCKYLHGTAMNALYNHVAISTHNIVGLFPTWHSAVALAEHVDSNIYSLEKVCLKRQEMFVRSLELRPEYGARVRRLTWTYFNRCDAIDQPISDQPTWTAFELLTSAKYLDFASMAWKLELIPPPLFFPAAKHIRLTGQMSFAFVRAMLGPIQAEHLVSLELNNVHDLGQYGEGKDFESMADLSTIPESEDENDKFLVRHPGNMRTHLKRIQSRCPRLRFLTLRSVGNDNNKDGNWSSAPDEARYQEWAAFILSVRPTLEHLTIEQGMEPTLHCIARCCIKSVQHGRPMDDRFLEHLLPALLEGDFLILKKLHVYGIGAEPRQEIVQNFRPKYHQLHRQVHEKLSVALGPQVELEVREHATKTFFCRISGHTYGS